MAKGRVSVDGPIDWSTVEPGTNSVVLDNGDGTETRHYRPIKDAADLEARLRADGVRIADGVELVEYRPGHWMQVVRLDAEGLRRLYVAIKQTREMRELLAQRAAIDKRLLELGMTLEQLGGQTITLNFWRYQKGNTAGQLLSAEYEFVSQASAFHGASDIEIAEVLYADEVDGTEATHRKLENRVRRIRSTLAENKILVRIDK